VCYINAPQPFCDCGTAVIPFPLTKIKKHKLLVRNSNILLLDTSTNKQFFQKLKSKKFNDSVILAFLECICYMHNLVIQQKEPVYISKTCRHIF